MEAFQLRLWDGRIGRWLSKDPKGQYASPYLGMGNNPISGIDPDGGYETWFGAFLSWVGGGFKGSIIPNPSKDNTDASRNYGILLNGSFDSVNKDKSYTDKKTGVTHLTEVVIPYVKYRDKPSSSGGGIDLLGAYQWHNRNTTLNFKADIGFDILKFKGMHYGVAEFETSLLDGQGAVTPGNFVLYPTGGSSKPYFSNHEPGHVLQYRILKPMLYYATIVIPSVLHADDPNSKNHYHEKSANTLWYLYTGEHDKTNPRYFFDK